ncbi:MAG: hypothetical protein ACLR4Z_04790 [Butyricicoccaceae bacterium]
MTLSELKQPVDPAFDLASFARSGLAYYRTFLLTDEIRRRLPSVTDKTLEAGETLYWESESLGGSSERFPYPPGTSSREKLLAALMERGKITPAAVILRFLPACLSCRQKHASGQRHRMRCGSARRRKRDSDTGSNRMQPHIKAGFLHWRTRKYA